MIIFAAGGSIKCKFSWTISVHRDAAFLLTPLKLTMGNCTTHFSISNTFHKSNIIIHHFQRFVISAIFRFFFFNYCMIQTVIVLTRLHKSAMQMSLLINTQ